MARTLIDLSIYLENDVVSDPPPYQPRIHYIDHKTSVPELTQFFPGLQASDLPDGEAWAIERVELITHNGTHLDAPALRRVRADFAEISAAFVKV